jgi:methionyl aminopeptidase
MIIIKTPEEIEAMRPAGRLVADCHLEIAKMIKPGITTLEINDYVEALLSKHGATPPTKGYHGYPFATCASVNDVIAHGFPNKYPLQAGDIVTIDIIASLNGWVGDSAWTYAVGDISPEAERLMEVTKESMYRGIAKAVPGNRLGDVMHEVQSYAETNGYSVVRDLLMHGIGRSMHEEPGYPHVGRPGKGLRLKEGMVITIEPMINEGTWGMFVEEDGWTARTIDGKLSAQYEHTVAITKDGPVVLTEQRP